MQKEVLYLRHRLQKGFLTRDQPPKESEMKTMADYISKLESYPELEVSIIRATKINKVLKGIIKLPSIPRDDEFHFKQRSNDLLVQWSKILASDPGTPTTGGPADRSEAATNAVSKAEKSTGESKNSV